MQQYVIAMVSQMGRISRWLTFLALMAGIYFAFRAFAPGPLHDFLVFLDDAFTTVHAWVRSAE